MARPRIGLDIGATAVRAVELSMRSSPPSVVRVAEAPLPPGAVSNGEVREPHAVTDALRELWQRGRFRSREVMLGVANQRVVVREVSLPWLADDELRQSLSFQVQEFVPIPIDEAVLDYHVLEEFENDGGRMQRLLLVAAHKSMVAQFVQAAEGARLSPVGVDLIPFAIVRSVGTIDGSGLDEEDFGDEALVEIGADVTSICVHAWGVPRFVRILPTGARLIDGSGEEDVDPPAPPPGIVELGDIFPKPEAKPNSMQLVTGRAGGFADEINSSLESRESSCRAVGPSFPGSWSSSLTECRLRWFRGARCIG